MQTTKPPASDGPVPDAGRAVEVRSKRDIAPAGHLAADGLELGRCQDPGGRREQLPILDGDVACIASQQAFEARQEPVDVRRRERPFGQPDVGERIDRRMLLLGQTTIRLELVEHAKRCQGRWLATRAESREQADLLISRIVVSCS